MITYGWKTYLQAAHSNVFFIAQPKSYDVKHFDEVGSRNSKRPKKIKIKIDERGMRSEISPLAGWL